MTETVIRPFEVTVDGQAVTGVLESILVSEVERGDILLLHPYVGKVSMLDTYSLGGTNWPCTRIYLAFDGTGRGFARFPHETVQRFKKES